MHPAQDELSPPQTPQSSSVASPPITRVIFRQAGRVILRGVRVEVACIGVRTTNTSVASDTEQRRQASSGLAEFARSAIRIGQCASCGRCTLNEVHHIGDATLEGQVHKSERVRRIGGEAVGAGQAVSRSSG